MNEFPSATLLKRILAGVYDVFPVLALWMLVGLIGVGVTGDAVRPNTIWFDLLLVLVTAAYFVLSWTRGGQTIGMRAWRLRVSHTDGTPLEWTQATLRFVVMALALGVFFLGVLWMLVDRERRMWQDIAANTQVMQLPK